MFKVGIVPKTVLIVSLLTLGELIVIWLLPESFVVINLLPILAVFLSLFVILAFILTSIAKKKLGFYTHLLLRLITTNLEETIESKSSDEFGEVVRSLETFRNALKERIRVAEESKDRAEAILLNVGEGVFAVNLRSEIIVFNNSPPCIDKSPFTFSKRKSLGLNSFKTR